MRIAGGFFRSPIHLESGAVIGNRKVNSIGLTEDRQFYASCPAVPNRIGNPFPDKLIKIVFDFWIGNYRSQWLYHVAIDCPLPAQALRQCAEAPANIDARN